MPMLPSQSAVKEFGHRRMAARLPTQPNRPPSRIVPGLKRKAMGMDIKRLRVKAPQNAEFTYLAPISLAKFVVSA